MEFLEKYKLEIVFTVGFVISSYFFFDLFVEIFSFTLTTR